MSGPMIVENFGDLLDARFRRIYDTEYEENVQESMIDKIFGKESSTRNYELVSGIGGMQDVPDFDGTLEYDRVGQLYDKTFNFPERAMGFKVSRKLYDDDLFHTMDRKPWQMAISVARTREKAAAGMLNGAFVGTDGPDSLSLCNASHPLSPDDATTWSNAGSTALSATAIEATRRIGHNSILNDRGEILNIRYDTIICTVNNEETAWEVINSTGKVETANNNRNFHMGRYDLVVWDRLTDSNNWFMTDSKLAKKFLLWWDRVKPEFAHDRDFDTFVAKWSCYMRYTVGWADGRPIYGHNVSG